MRKAGLERVGVERVDGLGECGLVGIVDVCGWVWMGYEHKSRTICLTILGKL